MPPSKPADPADRRRGAGTTLAHSGRDPHANHGIVNPPVYHASTVLFRNVADLRTRNARRLDEVVYGRFGTPTTFAFEEAMAETEGGARTVATSSGKAAVITSLMAFLCSGDHLLMTDATYGPSRSFADRMLARFGIKTTFYDPCIGGGIRELIRPNTKVVYLESPGSLTFEVQDTPAIAAAAHERGCTVILDNTWASPLLFRPFEHEVDVSVQAATKYVVGHSDAMLGAVTTTAEVHERVRRTAHMLGAAPGPDDLYLGLRGLRTLEVRLQRHAKTGLRLARWLEGRNEVERVLHPALPGCPGHELWKRDFLGTSGLFGVVLAPAPQEAFDAMLDALKIFGMGFSWGGFESLMIPTTPEKARTAVEWDAVGRTFRIHAGLEDPEDLEADLNQAFGHIGRAS